MIITTTLLLRRFCTYLITISISSVSPVIKIEKIDVEMKKSKFYNNNKRKSVVKVSKYELG